MMNNKAWKGRKVAIIGAGAVGATYFAIGVALVRIVEAILRNQHSVLTVSTHLNGEYGIKDVCLSLPCIVSQRGIERVIEGSLTADEVRALSDSASVLQKTFAELQKA